MITPIPPGPRSRLQKIYKAGLIIGPLLSILGGAVAAYWKLEAQKLETRAVYRVSTDSVSELQEIVLALKKRLDTLEAEQKAKAEAPPPRTRPRRGVRTPPLVSSAPMEEPAAADVPIIELRTPQPPEWFTAEQKPVLPVSPEQAVREAMKKGN